MTHTHSAGHWYMLLACCSFHLTYFYLVKFFVPYIAMDRRRLAWVLTFTTALIISVVAPCVTFGSMGTTFSDPLISPHSVHSLPSHSPLLNDINESFGFLRRYDIVFRPTPEPVMNIHQEPMVPYVVQDQGLVEPDSDTDFGAESDTISSGSTSSLSFGQSRWFFDMRYAPSDSLGGQGLVIFFVAYLLTDLLIGLLHYREKISFFAGWFHHTLYIMFCFYTIQTGQSHIFASFFIIEVPTAIMGLGQLHKPLRSDMLFSASFICFRIVYDFALTHEMVVNRSDIPITLKGAMLFKSLMHFKFLADLIKQQIRLRSNKSVERKSTDISTAASTKTMGECCQSIEQEEAILRTSHSVNGSRVKHRITSAAHPSQKMQ
ncbi:hypothetical protein BG011_007210 [Mortierella polycephala]|uniref:TLC domain-containing protein n=1 Tax=Mortierella polycephala TaxID=41804 RepID=A0A9P6TZ04_9FUNG|nr:hypothetical protein BG011_007210 [Mortierella polycephala]